MGSSILSVVALVILVSSGASARKCYECVYATGINLSEFPTNPPLPVTAACASGNNIPASFEKECSAENQALNVIRQTINAASPQIGKKINSILDKLSAEMAKNPRQAAEYSCGTLDFSVTLKSENGDPLAVTATGRACFVKIEGESDASVCERMSGQRIVNEWKQANPTLVDLIDEAVDEIIKEWPTFLKDNIGMCYCEDDLCTKKAAGGSGVIEVYIPLTIISALLSIILFHN